MRKRLSCNSLNGLRNRIGGGAMGLVIRYATKLDDSWIIVDFQDVGEGWWEGVNSRGQQGLFPESYVEAMSPVSGTSPSGAANRRVFSPSYTRN